MSERDVVCTGLGVASPLGVGVESFWSSSLAGTSGVARIATFDASKFTCQVAGIVRDVETSAHYRGEWSVHDRCTTLALVASSEAIASSRLGSVETDTRIGTYVGSSVGGVITHESECGRYLSGRRVHPTAILRVMQNASAAAIASHNRFSGPSVTISNACASSAQAFAEAYNAIRRGEICAAIVGGVEAPLSEPLFAAWDSMRVMSRWNGRESGACRPFSLDRSGLVLGEGAAFAVLEDRAHAEARGAVILGRMLGYASTTTTAHLTSPDAEKQYVAMDLALKGSRSRAQDVVYVQAHGTGTPSNDVAETKALHLAFGAHAKALQVSSGKSQYGHTLGAAGAFGVATAFLALRDRRVPPTINLDTPDPECDLNYVPNKQQPLSTDGLAMVNAFAFGGTNISIVIGQSI